MATNYEFIQVQTEPFVIAVNIHLVSRIEAKKGSNEEPYYCCFMSDGSWVPMDKEGYELFKETVCR